MFTKLTPAAQAGGPAAIGYIQAEWPAFTQPPVRGERYERLVPDTLDLQDRASLAINGLTAPTDPDADYEIYWILFPRARPPVMEHSWCDACQAKYMEALPLMRLISGSELNEHVERRWMETTLQMQGPDGLLYYPEDRAAVGRDPGLRRADTRRPLLHDLFRRPDAQRDHAAVPARRGAGLARRWPQVRGRPGKPGGRRGPLRRRSCGRSTGPTAPFRPTSTPTSRRPTAWPTGPHRWSRD